MSEEAQRMQYIGEQDLREYPADGPTNRQLRKPRWTRWRKIETRLRLGPTYVTGAVVLAWNPENGAGEWNRVSCGCGSVYTHIHLFSSVTCCVTKFRR